MRRMKENALKVSVLIKTQPSGFKPEVRRLSEEFKALQRQADREAGRLSGKFGLSVDAVEALMRGNREPPEERYNRREMNEVPAGGLFDEILPTAVERLLSQVKPTWLRAQEKLPYRLDAAFRTEPLSVLNGFRVD